MLIISLPSVQYNTLEIVQIKQIGILSLILYSCGYLSDVSAGRSSIWGHSITEGRLLGVFILPLDK